MAQMDPKLSPEGMARQKQADEAQSALDRVGQAVSAIWDWGEAMTHKALPGGTTILWGEYYIEQLNASIQEALTATSSAAARIEAISPMETDAALGIDFSETYRVALERLQNAKASYEEYKAQLNAIPGLQWQHETEIVISKKRKLEAKEEKPKTVAITSTLSDEYVELSQPEEESPIEDLSDLEEGFEDFRDDISASGYRFDVEEGVEKYKEDVSQSEDELSDELPTFSNEIKEISKLNFSDDNLNEVSFPIPITEIPEPLDESETSRTKVSSPVLFTELPKLIKTREPTSNPNILVRTSKPKRSDLPVITSPRFVSHEDKDLYSSDSKGEMHRAPEVPVVVRKPRENPIFPTIDTQPLSDYEANDLYSDSESEMYVKPDLPVKAPERRKNTKLTTTITLRPVDYKDNNIYSGKESEMPTIPVPKSKPPKAIIPRLPFISGELPNEVSNRHTGPEAKKDKEDVDSEKYEDGHLDLVDENAFESYDQFEEYTIPPIPIPPTVHRAPGIQDISTDQYRLIRAGNGYARRLPRRRPF
ncbi:hypothetical protein M434DRAFT_384888 [Hypoxylon sp. CO27-5]|nr:hypothetical protein M434DRAFT_384888 [Hypoxylon sp. CO27-5]